MTIFFYDRTFDGLLSCIFFAYEQKVFPDSILSDTDSKPLFIDEQYHIVTKKNKSQRVWQALKQKLSPLARQMMFNVWLSEVSDAEMLLFRYIRKNIDHPNGIEINFGDDDVLRIKQIAKKVSSEAHKLIEFIRFQETADGIYFAPINPKFNILSLIAPHFQERYANQSWIIYDTARNLGLHYDTKQITEVSFSKADLANLRLGDLSQEKLSEKEATFQEMWKAYFKSITITERLNPKLQQQHMPKKYWKYLTEMK